MAIDYEPLFDLMEKKGITWYQLEQQGLDNKTVQRIRDHDPLTTTTLEKLCRMLDCQPGSILRYVPDRQEKL